MMWLLFILLHIVCVYSRLNYMFLLSNENWTITGNQHTTEARFSPITIHSNMSRFILGNDTLIDSDSKNKNDKKMWYFKSPSINVDLSNYKNIHFSLFWLAGMDNYNDVDHYIRICSHSGCTKYIDQTKYTMADGVKTFHIKLEKPFWTANYEKIIRNVSHIYILGDWSQWYETIGLDNFIIS